MWTNLYHSTRGCEGQAKCQCFCKEISDSFLFQGFSLAVVLSANGLLGPISKENEAVKCFIQEFQKYWCAKSHILMEGTSILLVSIVRFLSGFIFYLLSRVLQPPPAQLWGWCCGSQGGLCCRSPTNGQHKLRNKGSLLNDETRQACLSHHQIVIWICFWFWQTQPIYKYWDGNAVNEKSTKSHKTS